jgi:hypothetical protein
MVQRARVNLCCGPVGDIPETRRGSLRAVQRSYPEPTGPARFPNFWIESPRRLESVRPERVPRSPGSCIRMAATGARSATARATGDSSAAQAEAAPVDLPPSTPQVIASVRGGPPTQEDRTGSLKDTGCGRGVGMRGRQIRALMATRIQHRQAPLRGDALRGDGTNRWPRRVSSVSNRCLSLRFIRQATGSGLAEAAIRRSPKPSSMCTTRLCR